MRIDRVADNVYVFISEMYVQVVASAILTPEGAVVVDTLPFPSETREMLAFLEREQALYARRSATSAHMRYVVLTHYHADHVYGAYLFERAEVIAHRVCWETLERSGAAGLARAKRETTALAEVELRLPDIAFERELNLHLDGITLRLLATPGHTRDGISLFYEEEKIFIAGDAMMPVPVIAQGDVEALQASLRLARALKPDFIIQGHGDVLLRGEVNETVDASLEYLARIVARVGEIVRRGEPPSALRALDIESCGLSRIPLDGLVGRLHQDNLAALYRRMSGL